MYQPSQPVAIISAPAAYPLAPGLIGRINRIETDPVTGAAVYSVITTERVGVQPRVAGRGGDLYECHGLGDADLSPIRLDGLPLADALGTAQRVAARHGATLDPVPGRPWCYRVAAPTSAALGLVRACLAERHGFLLGSGDEVDLSACPLDATPEEREAIADRLAEAAEREAREELREAGEGLLAVDSRSADAGRQAFSRAMQQTIVALRQQA